MATFLRRGPPLFGRSRFYTFLIQAMPIQILQDGRFAEVTKEQLFKMAEDGQITPDTQIRVGEKESTAGKVKGIEFKTSEQLPKRSCPDCGMPFTEGKPHLCFLTPPQGNHSSELQKDILANVIAAVILVAIIAGIVWFAYFIWTSESRDVIGWVSLTILVCVFVVVFGISLLNNKPTGTETLDEKQARLGSQLAGGCLIVVSLLIAVIAIIGGFHEAFTTTYDQRQAENAEREQEKEQKKEQQQRQQKSNMAEYEAINKAQKQVKEDLLSPSTAKFGGTTAEHSKSTGKWRISGWVESKNAFGTTVRNQYSIVVDP